MSMALAIGDGDAPRNPSPTGAASADALRQLLLDALPAGALLVDAAGKIAALNRQAERLLGWAAADLLGQDAHQLLDCDLEDLAAEPHNCPIARTLDGENLPAPARMGLRGRGGKAKPVEYRCSAYPIGNGMGALLCFNDISRQLALEKDLRSLASVAEACPLAIVELNQDANLLHANPAMMQWLDRFGFGAGLHAAVLPENIEELVTQCLTQQAEIGAVEVNLGDHCYEWKLVPVAGEAVVRGYGVDLSVRKGMEVALAGAKNQAEAANRAKSEFLTNMSHELRTPVNGVVGMAEILLDSPLTEEQRDCAQTILSSADSLMRLIEELLTMADLASGRSPSAPSEFALTDLLRQVSEPCRQAAEQKGLRFNLEVAPGVPGSLCIDRTGLAQALQQLLSNAVKFIAAGSIRLAVDLLPAAERCRWLGANAADDGRAALRFAVSDTGIGIAPEQFEKIFERFVQADGSSRRSFGGAGLGLSVAKELIEAMGGAIYLDSELGRGSCFCLVVPLPSAA